MLAANDPVRAAVSVLNDSLRVESGNLTMIGSYFVVYGNTTLMIGSDSVWIFTTFISALMRNQIKWKH